MYAETERSAGPTWGRGAIGVIAVAVLWALVVRSPGTSTPGVGRIGTWSIPIVVDDAQTTIGGGLRQAAKPSLWPWVVLWLAAVAAALAVATRASRTTLRAR